MGKSKGVMLVKGGSVDTRGGGEERREKKKRREGEEGGEKEGRGRKRVGGEGVGGRKYVYTVLLWSIGDVNLFQHCIPFTLCVCWRGY